MVEVLLMVRLVKDLVIQTLIKLDLALIAVVTILEVKIAIAVATILVVKIAIVVATILVVKIPIAAVTILIVKITIAVVTIQTKVLGQIQVLQIPPPSMFLERYHKHWKPTSLGETKLLCFKIFYFLYSSKPLIDSINKAGTARWYTGCYVNDEDQCFDKKLTNELNPLDSLTELEPSLRAFPVPANFKLKKQALKTNGASSKLGLSILLDPMLHDQINGQL